MVVFKVFAIVSFLFIGILIAGLLKFYKCRRIHLSLLSEFGEEYIELLEKKLPLTNINYLMLNNWRYFEDELYCKTK